MRRLAGIVSEARIGTHRDLEFGVGGKYYKSFDEATPRAVFDSLSTERPVNIDVIAYSGDGAQAWHGSGGYELYDEDPDASVFDRIVVTAKSLGRVS